VRRIAIVFRLLARYFYWSGSFDGVARRFVIVSSGGLWTSSLYQLNIFYFMELSHNG
jgi:hypothetical protein